MNLDQIIPAIALIGVNIVLPSFIETNLEKKTFFKNLSIWTIIVLFLVILLYLLF